MSNHFNINQCYWSWACNLKPVVLVMNWRGKIHPYCKIHEEEYAKFQALQVVAENEEMLIYEVIES